MRTEKTLALSTLLESHRALIDGMRALGVALPVVWDEDLSRARDEVQALREGSGDTRYEPGSGPENVRDALGNLV